MTVVRNSKDSPPVVVNILPDAAGPQAVAGVTGRGKLRETITCDFCDKHKREVRGMVERSNGQPRICDECIYQCAEFALAKGWPLPAGPAPKV